MRFADDQRGAVAIIAAVSAGALLTLAAMAIDLGSVFMRSRQLQGMADLAALSAVQDPDHAQAAAEATVAANAWDSPVATTVQLGGYRGDPATPVGRRFTPGGGATDAARATLTSKTPLFFANIVFGRPDLTLSRTGVAARTRLASFSLGSRLAALRGGAANALLSALTGGGVELSVMDYNALASADVDLFDYLGALRTRMNLRAASFDDLLSTRASAPTALRALGDALTLKGNGVAAAAANTLALASSAGQTLALDQLVDLGPLGGGDQPPGGLAVSLKALDLAGAALTTAQGGHQVRMNLGATVPGLASTTAWLAIGQRPQGSSWITVTNDDSVIVRTAQTRLYLKTSVGAGAGLLHTLGLAQVNLPLYVEAASAEARLSSIACGSTPASRSVALSVAPSVGEIAVGELDPSRLDDFSRPVALTPATLVDVLLVRATAQAVTRLGGLEWRPVSFTGAEIADRTVKTVRTADIAQASVASLLGSLDVQVRLGGLTLLSTGAVSSALGALIAPAAAPLDTVIGTLGDLTGVRLGEADVTVNGVRCQGAALVS